MLTETQILSYLPPQFRGGTVVSVHPTSEGDLLNLAGDPTPNGLHRINAPRFSALAPGMVALGWSVFPQTRDSRRGPGKVDGVPLAWKPFQTRLPTQDEISWWAAFCPSHNVAVILGDASGGAMAVDIDVSDVRLGVAIQLLADRILGYTPFRRVGRHPRIVLIYRQALVSQARPDDVIPTRQLRFAKLNAEDLEGPGALEILGAGKPVTVHGLHHGTGQHFRHLDLSPHRNGPEHAPLITRAQMDEFLDAVNALHAFDRRAHREALAETWVFDENAGVHRPAELGQVDWQDSDGRVVGGREAFLWRLVVATVRANENLARDLGRGRQQLCATIEADFLARAELGGKWTAEHLRTEIVAKVRSSCECHIEGNHFARTVRAGRPVSIDVDGQVAHAPSRLDVPEPVEVKALGHLLPRGVPRGFLLEGRSREFKLLARADEARATERALVTDDALRTDSAQAAVNIVLHHEHAFIVDELYERAARRRVLEADKMRPADVERALGTGRIGILRGDAGVGKSRGFWKAMGRAKAERGPLGYPVGFSAPSHALIEENLEKAVAERLAWEKVVSAEVVEAERYGLKVVVFRGRLRTNCGYKPQLVALEKAKIQAERLCRARVRTNAGAIGEKPAYETVACPMFDACEYQRSIAELASADVVLFASAYLSVQPPAALSRALIGLFVDERPYDGLLHDNAEKKMPVDVLKRGRAAPRLDKEEMEALLKMAKPRDAIDARKEGYLADREAAVRMMMPHLSKGAAGKAMEALHDYRPGGERRGLAYAESALLVCSRTSDAAKEVRPGLSIEEAAALVATPVGEGLFEERRFWILVVERLHAMRDDEDWAAASRMLRQSGDEAGWDAAIESLRAMRDDPEWRAAVEGWATTAVEWPAPEPRARGRYDARIQVVDATFDKEVTGKDGRTHTVRTKGKGLRMSWRGKPNFGGLPLLLLDASAEPRIVEKVWPGRDIRVLEVQAPYHARTVWIMGSTFSDTSLRPELATRTGMKEDVYANVQRVRELITRLAAVHGSGRLLVGSNRKVQKALRANWLAPLNVDWCWNGAMRGLDQFKNHVAALMIGRQELPISAIDAQVAALTYDDPTPEEPVDYLGTGVDADGEPIRMPKGERTVLMRDGSAIGIQDTMYKGRWAQIVHRQKRDEEVRQFAARLRPVHRLGEPPIVYLACTAIPEGTIVDAKVSIDDLAAVGKRHDALPWEIARQTDGVLDPTLGFEAREDLGGPEGAVELLSALRLDKPGNAEAAGTIRIRWRMPGGEWRPASLMLWHDDLLAPLHAAVAREWGLDVDEVREALEFEVIAEHADRKPSGTRPPDSIDFELTGLPPGATRAEVRQAYADAEAADRLRVMERIRHQLAGVGPGATEEEVKAGLKRRRIAAIDWRRLQPPDGSSRKDGTIPLAVMILMDRYGVGGDDDEDDAIEDAA